MRQGPRAPVLCLLPLLLAPAVRAADDTFKLSVGPAVEITPTYPGAGTLRTFVLPDVEMQYHGWLYISATDLIGVYAYNHDGTKAGAAIEWDFTERLARDSPRLTHLGDVSTTPRFKLFFEPRLARWLSAGIEAATDIGGHDEGTVVQAHLELLLPLTAHGYVTIGPGVTWSDSRYMTAFYGVTAEQSELSGLAQFVAREGVSDVYLEAVAGYELSHRWAVGLDLTVAALQGDAAHSPFTEQRRQSTLLAAVLYRLR